LLALLLSYLMVLQPSFPGVPVNTGVKGQTSSV